MKTSLAPPRPIRLDLGGAPKRGTAPGEALQPSFDELGTPLSDVTFVVVDLETTGGSPGANAITEIGAVKVRGGEVLGTFQTLVNPGVPIPPQITVLTGITTMMVVDAPMIAEAYPSFIEWAGFNAGNVLVAHNARFDVGFLRAAARELGYTWPSPQVVDTLALARRLLTRDEAPNCKLGTLARLFRTETEPTHRALDDALATTDVLHGLFERYAPLGVTHLEDLASASDPVPAARRRKVSLAEHVPHGPGVYQFIGPGGEVLYVGTATDLRSRVRSYFTAAEKRRRMGEMVDLASEVRAMPCGSVIEARVLELRLIDEHQPAYNRRSRAASNRPWLVLTDERHPRLSIVRNMSRERFDVAWGPFSSTSQARLALDAMVRSCGLRTCNDRLPAIPREDGRACALLDIGGCFGPCVSSSGAIAHNDAVAKAQRILSGVLDEFAADLHHAISDMAADLRYEEAGHLRDQLRAAIVGARRAERLRATALNPEVLVARPVGSKWELLLMRWGRFAGTGIVRHGEDPWDEVYRLLAAGEYVPEPQHMGEAATIEETELLVGWMESPGTRVVMFGEEGAPYAYPISGGHSTILPPSRHDAA